jgi:nitrogen fixation NifU-like protein
VQRYPSRIKCALLGWHALAHALNDRPGGASETSTEQSNGSKG